MGTIVAYRTDTTAVSAAEGGSKAGQLDWWVKERQEWWVAYTVRTAASGGSELLIFVPSAAHSPDL
jgi:hypothetical protein